MKLLADKEEKYGYKLSKKVEQVWQRLDEEGMDLKLDEKSFLKQNFESKNWIVAYTNLTSLQIRVQVEKLKIYQEK